MVFVKLERKNRCVKRLLKEVGRVAISDLGLFLVA